MADLQKEIELASLQFQLAVEKMESSVVNAIVSLKKQGLTTAETHLALSAIDMDDFILKDLGFQTDIDNLMVKYQTGVLANIKMVGDVTEPMLQSLVAMDRATFIKQAGYNASLIKQDLARKVLGNATPTQMLNSLKTVVRPDQAKTLVNTTLNTFSRTVNDRMAETSPPSKKYIYEGPVDDRTRDICLQMASEGAISRSDITSNYPGSFQDGGGYNCRHRWVATEAAGSKFLNPTGAKERIESLKKKGRWETPKTFQEQLSA